MNKGLLLTSSAGVTSPNKDRMDSVVNEVRQLVEARSNIEVRIFTKEHLGKLHFSVDIESPLISTQGNMTPVVTVWGFDGKGFDGVAISPCGVSLSPNAAIDYADIVRIGSHIGRIIGSSLL